MPALTTPPVFTSSTLTVDEVLWPNAKLAAVKLPPFSTMIVRH